VDVLNMLLLALAIDKDVIYIYNTKMVQILEKYLVYFALEYRGPVYKSK
jgi:hypothetical protein